MTKNGKSMALGLLTSAGFLTSIMAQNNTEPYTAGDKTAGVAEGKSINDNWMATTRFGMFIHFGLYSIPAGIWKEQQMGRNSYAEWIRSQWNWPEKGGIPKAEYDELLKEFNPEKFDAEEWIGLAAEAGMKYFVITAKHHDGFALWDSKVSEYDIASTPFGANGRDLLGELVKACRKHGIKVGFYYSHWQDWEHEGGALPPWPEIKPDPPLTQPTDQKFADYWEKKCLAQVSELIDNYDPDMFWFDSWGQGTKAQVTPERRDQLIALIRKKSKKCMINGRIAAYDPAGADFVSMGDNQYPTAANAPKVPWETPGTMNHSWGYHRLDFEWKNQDQLMSSLVNNAHYGGAITLNVGPLGDGRFPQAAVRRLKNFAAWMDINEIALQPTMRSPFEEGVLPKGIKATTGVDPQKPLFYLFVDKAANLGEISLPQPLILNQDGVGEFRAQVLESREFLKIKHDGKQLKITLPKSLLGIDQPVIQVGPASSIPHIYEDGVEVKEIKRGRFDR